MADGVALTAEGLASIQRAVNGLLKAVPILLGKTALPAELAETSALRVAFEVDGCMCVVAVVDGEPSMVVLQEASGG